MSKQQLPDSLVALLKNSGLSDQALRRSSLDTRVYHDLGFYGDPAWWFVEELGKLIDMSKFNFDHYFPPECYGESFVAGIAYGMVPFANWLRRRNGRYAPLSMRMIARCIENGSWDEVAAHQENGVSVQKIDK